MGLGERRAAKQFEDEAYPGLLAEIEKAAGFAVPVEVAWDDLMEEGYGHMYMEAWYKVYFEPIIVAFKNITMDAMGKDALKVGLKKIIIQNKSGNYSGSSVATFEGGVLTIDHQPMTNIDDLAERAQGIQKTLEAKL